MNHRRCYQHAPLPVRRGPIHGESDPAAADTAGWDAAPVSMSLGHLIHRESTERRRRFLIHRESDLGKNEHSARRDASGIRGLRDRTRRMIHRESSPSWGENLIHHESGIGEYDDYEHSACLWNTSSLRGLRDHFRYLIHRESPIGEATAIPRYVGHPKSGKSAATSIARYPHIVTRRRLSGLSIHRESPIPHIHRTAPNNTASMPTHLLTSTPIHRESEHPKEGPTS